MLHFVSRIMWRISSVISLFALVLSLAANANGFLLKPSVIDDEETFPKPTMKATILSESPFVRDTPSIIRNQIISGDLPCECGHAVPRPLDDRITGDWKEKAKITDMSWTVALVFKGNTKKPFCGGTLINDRFVLTAAHCVNWAKPEDLEVRLNEEDFLLSNENHGGELLLGVTEIVEHPRYRGYLNDIALLRLSESVNLTKTAPIIVRPICISTNNETDYSGVNGTVAGWGRTSYSGEVSRVLLKIDVPILSNQDCNENSKYNGAIRDSMLCAGILENGGPDSCPGDSGGPLTVFVGRRAVLVGIVSWGFGCGEPYSPGVYTRVSYFSDWISENTMDSGWCQARKDNS